MRKTSFKILYDIFFGKVLLNDAINSYFNDAKLSIKDEDKSFIKREVTGIIENIDDIDKKIDEFSKVKVKKLDRDILLVLRLGIYEMTYMDKVPSYATVSECVDIIKKSRNSKFSGYVNAVLRNYARANKNESKIVSSDSKKCYFRICHEKKDAVLSELKSKNISYKSYVGALDFKKAEVYSVKKYKDIIDTKNFKDGNVLIEDASSIYMTEKLSDFLKESDSVKILDACSSPGGKILGLIDLLQKINIKYDAVSCDISKDKVLKIKENVDRLRTTNIKILVKDATLYDKDFREAFDLVICDVPCTGLGVIDKKPDIKLNYSDDKRDALAKIQIKILETTKDYVKKGGIISYSTCTETKEENEENVNHFLNANTNFEKVYEKKIKRNDEHNADGFYMCFMKKNK